MFLLPYYSSNWVLKNDWNTTLRKLRVATGSRRSPLKKNNLVQQTLLQYDLTIKSNGFRLKKRNWNPQAPQGIVIARYKQKSVTDSSLDLTFRPKWSNILTLIISWCMIIGIIVLLSLQYNLYQSINFYLIGFFFLLILANKYSVYLLKDDIQKLEKLLKEVLED